MRKALEDLIFLGRLEETFTLAGAKWTLATLSSQERMEAAAETAAVTDQIARITALKVALLGRALKQINNEQFSDTAETTEFVTKMQAPLLDRLFSKYEELQAKQEKALEDPEEVKN